jgi:hypothetical protein
MELLIFNTEKSEFYHDDELAMVKTALLLAEKVTVVNYNFRDIVFYCNYKKMTVRKIKEYYLDTVANSDLENKNELFEEGTRMFKEEKELRNQKYKIKDEIVYMERLNIGINTLKTETVEQERMNLEEDHKMPLIKFYTDNVLSITIYDPDENKKTATMSDRLIKAFTKTDAIQFFDQFVLSEKDIEDDQSSTFLSGLLFSIPDMNTLTYEQLFLIRYELMDKLNAFYDMVSDMQKEFSKVLFNKDTTPFIEERTTELLNPFFELVKDTLENNIYIQQVKNSVINYNLYNLHFCVASIKMIIGFYVESKIITAEDATQILAAIANKKDINTCCFFFYNYVVISEHLRDVRDVREDVLE